MCIRDSCPGNFGRHDRLRYNNSAALVSAIMEKVYPDCLLKVLTLDFPITPSINVVLS